MIQINDDLILKFSSFFDKLPHKWGCWNCGMEIVNNEYLFTCRNETSKYNKDFFGRKTPQDVRWERYCPSLVRLDSNFNYISSKPARLATDELLEDVRLFYLNGQLAATGTKKNKAVGRVDQFLAYVINDTLMFLPLQHKFPLHQKNWNTIVSNGSLYFEQSISRPRRVLKYSFGSVNTINEKNYKEIDNLRGNCQTVEFDDFYVGIYHNHHWRRYYHFFSLIEKNPPFNIIGVTPPMRLKNAEKWPIQFITGAVKDGDSMILSYGVQDSDNYVSRVGLSKITKNIKNIKR